MSNLRPAIRAAILSAAIAGGIAASVPRVAAETPLPPNWRVLSLPGKATTQFAATTKGGISVSADASVGFLYSPVSEIPGRGRFLTWRWRVDAAPPPTDLSAKGMDDRPLAVHVWFGNKDDAVPDWDLGTRLGAWLFDRPLPGKMLTYVWGGTAQRGDRLRNPYRENAAHLIVLRPGGSRLGRWFRETVDVAGDFKAIFGYPPGPPAYLAISADTDDKGGTSTGVVADLAFTDAP